MALTASSKVPLRLCVLDSPDLECLCLALLGRYRRLTAFLELFQAGAVLTEVRLCAHEDDSRQRSEVLKNGEPRLGGVGEAVPLEDGEATSSPSRDLTHFPRMSRKSGLVGIAHEHARLAHTSVALGLSCVRFFCLNGFAFLIFHVSSLSPKHRVPWLFPTRLCTQGGPKWRPVLADTA